MPGALRLLRAAVTLAFLGLVAWYVDPMTAINRVTNVQPVPLLWAGLLLGVQLMVFALRWKLIIDDGHPSRVRFLDLCRYLGASNLYGQLLPSSVGADLVRAGMLARTVGIGPATTSAMVDRITGLVVLLFLIIVTLPALAWRIDNPPVVASVAAASITGLAVFVGGVFFARRFSIGLMRQFGEALRRAMLGREIALPILACGLATHLASVALIYLIAMAIGAPVSFLDCLLLVPPSLLVTALPISLSGWGVREGALAGSFALVGVPVTDSVTISILFGLTGPLIGLVYGVLNLFARRDR